jgi:hypothetical protein
MPTKNAKLNLWSALLFLQKQEEKGLRQNYLKKSVPTMEEGYEYIEAYPLCHNRYGSIDFQGSVTFFEKFGFEKSGEKTDDCFVVRKYIEQLSASPITSTQEQINADLNFWQKINRLAADAGDEVLSPDDFPRTKFNRELIVFDDEV